MVVSDVYVALAQRLNCPGSEPLMRVLRKLVTPEEGRVLLELPAGPAALAKKYCLDEEVVRDKLQEFLERGLVIPTSKGLQMARDVTQLHDSTLSSAEKWVDTELLDLWKEFHQVEWVHNMVSALSDSYVQFIRVLPALKAIERSPHISIEELLPEENILELIKGADSIAVVPCCCRRSMRRCKSPLDVCLQFNKGAKYAIDRKSGREISAVEAIEIAKRAEEAGLIHTWPARASGRLNEICNCCIDCCVIFDSYLRAGKIAQVLKRSRFRAAVDRELCTGCQDCVERCFFGAIDMAKAPESKKLKAAIDTEKCFGCGLCAVICEPAAITMELA